MLTIVNTAHIGLGRVSAKASTKHTCEYTVRRAVICAVVAAAATAATVDPVDQDSVDTNQVHELLVAPKPLKELGLGKHKSGHLMAFLSVGEL